MDKIRLLIYSNKTFFKYLIKYAKIMLILDIIFLFTYNIFPLIRMYAPKYFIDEILYNKSFIKGMFWILLLCVSDLYITIKSSLYSKWKNKFLLNAKLEATKEAYHIFENTYISNFEDSEKMDVFHRGIEYAENGGVALYSLIANIISTVSSGTIVAIVSMQFKWWLWIIIAITFLLKLYITKICQKKNYLFNRDHTLLNRLIQYYSDTLKQKSSLQESRIYNTVDFFLKKLCDKKLLNYEHEKKHEINLMKFSLLSLSLDKLLDIICYTIIGTAMISGEATLSDYTLFFATIARINTVLNGIQATVMMASQETINVQNYNEFITECKKSSYNQSCIQSQIHISDIDSIEFKNVSFTYNNQITPAINDISLNIRKGEKISIVGLNGAGKSTFIKLLMGLYFIETGSISINGNNINNIYMQNYWEKIGVVFQDYNIYPISVAENLIFNQSLSHDIIQQSLEKVKLKDKINALPNGINSMISQMYHNDGIDFSGGEKQRLAIARAFSKDAQLYIFDEPSSALDAISEERLYKIINSISNDKTVIFISHRLSSISSTNRIILFDNGKIIGDGTHQELLNNCVHYKELYETQVNRYGKTIL